MSSFEIIAILFIALIWINESKSRSRTWVEVFLQIHVTLSPEFKSKHLWLNNCENKTIHVLHGYLPLNSIPYIGVTYSHLDLSVKATEVRYDSSGQWQIWDKNNEWVTTQLRNDQDLYVGLMSFLFDQGWDFKSLSLAHEFAPMKLHPEYWDRSRKCLEKNIGIVSGYRKYSGSAFSFWWKYSKDPLLTTARSKAQSLWNEMPEVEREKLPKSYIELYRKLIA